MGKYPWDWILIGLAVALVIGFAWKGVGRCESACLDKPAPYIERPTPAVHHS